LAVRVRALLNTVAVVPRCAPGSETLTTPLYRPNSRTMATLTLAEPPDRPGMVIVPVTEVIVPVDGLTLSEPEVIGPLFV
jgi:hypothetical protein